MAKATVKIGDEFSTKYGPCVVVKYENCENVFVKFLNTGGITKTNTSDLRRDSVKDYYYPTVEGKGYYGYGDYVSRIGGKLTEEYSVWQGMIKRCYNKVILSKEPSYIGCEVCENWLNFQNFATWMNTIDYRKEKWQIDKDLIEFGNKIYCPEKCLFIPASINKCLVTHKQNPNAGIKMRGNKFQVFISIYNKNTYFGSCDTLEEAKELYRKSKLNYLYELSEKEGVPDFIVNKFEQFIIKQQNQI